MVMTDDEYDDDDDSVDYETYTVFVYLRTHYSAK